MAVEIIMTNTEFHQSAEALLEHIEQQIEQQELDVDVDNDGNVLTIEFNNGSHIVLNKQEPLHQVWLATKFNGHHFSYENGQWFDQRNQIILESCLIDAFLRQAQIKLSL